MKKKSIPKLAINHLFRLTDDTGLLQHSKFIIPDRKYGYCTDDNARALIFITKYYRNHPTAEAIRLFETYLAFIYQSIKPDKTVYNFMEYDRRWKTYEPAADALGRVIWALGSVIGDCPDKDYTPFVKEFFCDTSNHIPTMSPRAKAYSILGLSEYLKIFPDDSLAVKFTNIAAGTLCKLFNDSSSSDWHWYEEVISYANAIMPAAMFAAADITKDKNYFEIAKKSCDFMVQHTFNGKHFSFIGSNGWHTKGKDRAQFDQQPIEAAYTVIMLAKAYESTKEKKYKTLQRKAFDWFLGDNDLNVCLYDSKTKGCRDGICKHGLNLNQGAESTLSYLLARVFLI
ncbi:MAG: hypothetical protein A2Y12_10940 [Planctomycetes bacterium GWF2_42_9]|nr:MAG: hypothetical protein A2Y12_10940 [Planctomycetes bacterium GWF2_42_9]